MRVGFGYDIHRCGPGEAVMLGGVRVPCDFGLVAHSDGDVLLHALCDALLGAVAAGDIGVHFPDTDTRWRDADSRTLLRAVARVVRDAGQRPLNVDMTLFAERPKIAGHAAAIRANVAADLDIACAAVSVKATTFEGIGAIGRGEAIAAAAVALVHAD